MSTSAAANSCVARSGIGCSTGAATSSGGGVGAGGGALAQPASSSTAAPRTSAHFPDEIRTDLRLGVTRRFELGERIEALLHPLVVDPVTRARDVGLMDLD